MTRKIIAEIGINHNGNLEALKAMAMTAVKVCGAHYVKIQKREIEYCYSEEQLAKPCESPWGTTVDAKVRGRELSWDQVIEFDDFCQENHISWFASCFDLASLEVYNRRFPGCPFNKVPSALATLDRSDYLTRVAAYKRPTIISTGLCKDGHEIRDIIFIFEKWGCDHVINHCVSLYPCPPDRLNLNYISKLTEFMNPGLAHPHEHTVAIGYSGHEVGLMPSVIAAHLGAEYIERHFTLDRSWYGADQAASLEPEGLRRLVRDIAELDTILGTGKKELRGDEKNPVTFWRGA